MMYTKMRKNRTQQQIRSDEDWQALVAILRQKSHWQYLDLSNCSMSEIPGNVIWEIVKHPSMTRMNIQGSFVIMQKISPGNFDELLNSHQQFNYAVHFSEARLKMLPIREKPIFAAKCSRLQLLQEKLNMKQELFALRNVIEQMCTDLHPKGHEISGERYEHIKAINSLRTKYYQLKHSDEHLRECSFPIQGEKEFMVTREKVVLALVEQVVTDKPKPLVPSVMRLQPISNNHSIEIRSC